MKQPTLDILTLSTTLILCSGGGITDDVTIEANITDSRTTEQIILNMLTIFSFFISCSLINQNTCAHIAIQQNTIPTTN